MPIETIRSEHNPLLKEIRRASSKGTLTADGLAIAEGPHLLDEAIRSGCEIGAVITSATPPPGIPPNTRVLEVTGQMFSRLASTENPQGILALVRPPMRKVAPGLIVVLDGIQDPGNAGAILRAAEAFGATGCIFLKGSVNPYNPKCIRASAGSLFRLPLATTDSFDSPECRLFAALPGAGQSIAEADLTGNIAIVIGGEGAGVSAAMKLRAIGVRIPTQGVESLNASVAAAIILYEARRQRSL